MSERGWTLSLAILPGFAGLAFLIAVWRRAVGLLHTEPALVPALWAIHWGPWILYLLWMTVTAGRLSAQRSFGEAERVWQARRYCALLAFVWFLNYTFINGFTWGASMFVVIPLAYTVFPAITFFFLAPQQRRHVILASVAVLAGISSGGIWITWEVLSFPGFAPSPWDLLMWPTVLLGLMGFGLSTVALALPREAAPWVRDAGAQRVPVPPRQSG